MSEPARVVDGDRFRLHKTIDPTEGAYSKLGDVRWVLNIV